MHQHEAPVVVICDDLGAPPVQLGLVELAERVQRDTPGANVKVVPGTCRAPKALERALSDIRPRRVVVGCRDASNRRGELLGRLRRAGVARGGIDIVDLRSADGGGGHAPREEIVFEQSAALLHAAAVRLASFGPEVPVRERTSLSAGEMSRRSLFGGSGLARQPVAVYLQESCDGGAACTACALACPQKAISRDGGRVAVSSDLCNDCGACVTACRSGAFALPGAGLDGLGAAAGVLIGAIRRGGAARGVAIACQHSKSAPRLGEHWLVLRVPSLEMVTAGWLFRLVVAGVGVCVMACQESTCEARAGNLEDFLGALAGLFGFSTEGPDGGPLPWPPPSAERPDAPVELREPEATTESLTVLGRLQPTRAWRAAGPGCPLGDVQVDLGACSFCGVCARACPTSALAADRDDAGSALLSFDSAGCTACGACVASCPEGAVRMERCADSALLATGRRLVARGPSVSCDACGAPLDTSLPAEALARLGGTHPFLVPGAGRICADCRLGGRTVSRARVG